MIKMVDRQQIIHMYRTRGLSKRAIGHALDINRKTVAKVIHEYESSLVSSDPEGSLDTLLTRKPVYDSSSRGRKVITVCYDQLSTGFESSAQRESSLRRIQRFMAAYALGIVNK